MRQYESDRWSGSRRCAHIQPPAGDKYFRQLLESTSKIRTAPLRNEVWRNPPLLPGATQPE
jgi:hypothetical protein